MHVVVTGGAGFIGSHLVDALIERTDDTVLIVDNLRRGRLVNLAHHDGDRRLRLLVADVREPEVADQALRDADLVYHLAAQSNVMGAVSDPRYSFETNVAGTFNVLQAARQHGVKRVVFASSREAYGEVEVLPVSEDQPLAAKNTYGASKAAAEVYCRTYTNVFGLETAVLRFANVYGPRDRDRVIPIWIERALRGDSLEVYGGQQVMDFVWVETVVEALLRAAEADVVGLPINVASGTGTAIGDLSARILATTGSHSDVCLAPARHAEVTRFVADVRRLRDRLGLVPAADPLAELPQLLDRRVQRSV